MPAPLTVPDEAYGPLPNRDSLVSEEGEVYGPIPGYVPSAPSAPLPISQDEIDYRNYFQSRENPNLEEREKKSGSIAQEVVRGLARGTDVAQANLYSAVGSGAEMFSPVIPSWLKGYAKKVGREGYERNLAEAKENPATIRNIEEVFNSEDASLNTGRFVRYLAGLAGEQAPQLAGGTAAAIAGGLVGGPIGAIGGAATWGYAQNQNFESLVSQGVDPGVAARTATAAGLLAGAIDSILPTLVVKRAMKLFPGIKQAAVKANLNPDVAVDGTIKSFFKRAVKDVPVGVFTEGGTEAVQEGIIMASEYWAHRDDPNFEIPKEEVRSRLLNAGVAGALMGGGTGVAMALIPTSTAASSRQARRDRPGAYTDTYINGITVRGTKEDHDAYSAGIQETIKRKETGTAGMVPVHGPANYSISVGVAPFRNKEIKDVSEFESAITDKDYLNFSSLSQELANILGIKLSGNVSSIGAWHSSDLNRGILETSRRISIVNADPVTANLYSALLGALAPNTQRAVYRFDRDAKGGDSEYRFKFRDDAGLVGAVEFLRQHPALKGGFTVDKGDKTIYLGDFGRERLGAGDIQSFVDKSVADFKLLDVNYENGKISFPSEREYRGYLQEARDSLPPDRRTGVLHDHIRAAEGILNKRGRKILGGRKPGRGELSTQETRPSERSVISRERYLTEERVTRLGLESAEQDGKGAVDTDYSAKAGEVHDQAPVHSLDSDTLKSYAQFSLEVKEQYAHMLEDLKHAGIKIIFVDPGQNLDDVYPGGHRQMIDDIEKNKTLKVNRGGDEHPLLGESQGRTDGLLVNEMFRALHDFYGHASGGNSFGALGEERAWLAHAQMFSPLARRAMTAETRMANSWVNFGPHMWNEHGWRGEESNPNYLPQKDRPFPPQKAYLPPPEFSSLDTARVLTPEGQVVTAVEKPLVAVGIPEIVKLIRDPKARLPQRTADIIEHLMTQPVFGLGDLDWSDLKLALVNRISGGKIQAQVVLDRFVTLTRGAGVEALPHEIFHILEGLLPKGFKAALLSHRNNRIDALLRSDIEPHIAALLEEVRTRQMTSEEFLGYALDGAASVSSGFPRGWSGMSHYLTEAQRAGLGKSMAHKISDLFRSKQVKLHPGEVAAFAKAGEIKRDWYKKAGALLGEMFGADKAKFVALLAATSPQVPVDANLKKALTIWKLWLDNKRPTDETGINAILDRVPAGHFGAHKNNIHTALTGFGDFKDIEASQDWEFISGLKVESFRKNLMGDRWAVTLDSWMAKLFGVEHKKWGVPAWYAAYSAVVRKAAAQLGWDPVEVQETSWSFLKTLSELADKKHIDLIQAEKILTDTMVAETPGFFELILNNEQVREKVKALAGRINIPHEILDTHPADLFSSTGRPRDGRPSSVRARRLYESGQIKDAPVSGRVSEVLRRDYNRALGRVNKAYLANRKEIELKARLAAKAKSKQRESIEATKAGELKFSISTDDPMFAEVYSLINTGEFLAHVASEKFVADTEEKKTLATKARDWFTALSDAIGRFLRISPSMGRIQRELLEGRHKGGAKQATPSAIQPKASLVKNPEEARRELEIAKSRSNEAVRVESAMISGQVGFLERKMQEHMPATMGHLEPREQEAVARRVNYFDILGIQARATDASVQATGVVPPAEFDDAIVTLPRDLQSTYQKEVGAQLKNWEHGLRAAIEDYEEQTKKISSKSVTNLVKRHQTAMVEAHLLDLAEEFFKADAIKGVAGATKLHWDRAVVEGIATGTLSTMTDAESRLNRASAVKGAIADIIKVLSKNEAGINLLLSVNPAGVPDLVKQYMIDRAYGRPEDIVIGWAAEVIAKDKTTIPKLVAIAAMKKDKEVQGAYTFLEQAIEEGLAKNPKKTVGVIVRGVSSRATKAERAMAAFRAMNSDLVKMARDYEVSEAASDLANAILADPEVDAYRKRVFGDVVEDRPEGYEDPDSLAMIKNVPAFQIGLPDGTTTKQIYLWGDAKKFQESWDELNRAIDVISDFLINNPEHQSSTYWNRRLEYLNSVLVTSRTLAPAKLIKPFGWDRFPFNPLGVTKFFTDMLGTRAAGLLKVSLANHSRSVELAVNLLSEQLSPLTNNIHDAVKSHGFPIINLRLGAEMWYQEVGNALFASWQNPEGGKLIGDKVNGHTITREDFDLLRFQSSITSKGFDIVQRDITRGREGVAQPIVFKTMAGDDVEMFVKSTKIGPLSVTREFRQESKDLIKDYVAHPDQRERLLNRDFWKVVVRHITDRANHFFDNNSLYEAEFKAISKDIEIHGLALYDRTLDWLAGRIDQFTGEGAASVKANLMAEFDKMMARLDSKINAEPSTEAEVKSLSDSSSFTEARRQNLAGDWLYNYGFKDSHAWVNFSLKIQGHYFKRAHESFGLVLLDLQRQQKEMNLKIDEAINGGRSQYVAKKEVMRSQADAVRLGQTYDDYRSLDNKIKQTIKLMDVFADVRGPAQNNADIDLGAMRRVLKSTVSGVLLSEVMMFRNLWTGWYYLGRASARYNGQMLATYPKAFWNLTGSLLKFGGSTLAGVWKVFESKIGGRSWRESIEEISNHLYDRIKIQKELLDRGYLQRPTVTHDVLAKLRSPADAGAIRSNKEDISVISDVGSTILTMMLESPLPILTIGKEIGRAGEAILNDASIKVGFDLIRVREDALRDLFEFYNRKGMLHSRFNFGRLNDPLNLLTPQEVFTPSFTGKFTRTATSLAQLNTLWDYSGTDFQSAAIKFLDELSKGNKAAKLIPTLDLEYNVAAQLMYDVNKANATNRSMYTLKKGLWEFVSPLMGWPTGMYTSMIRQMSTAPSDSRAISLIGTGAFFVIPFLIMGALSDTSGEWLLRQLTRFGRGEIRPTRLPWEREGARSKTIGWLLSGLNSIPFVQTLANSALNDLPTRASQDIGLFVFSKLKDITSYFGGVAQTGDPAYGFRRLMTSFIPASSIFINRLPSVQGTVHARDARRALTVYGPQELLRPVSKATTGHLTPLSPISERAMNALMAGNVDGFREARQDYIDKARSMGKADPEQSFLQMVRGKSPYNAAFKTSLTEEQREATLAKMPDHVREIVRDVEGKISQGVDISGGATAPSFARRPPSGGGSGGTGSSKAIPRSVLAPSGGFGSLGGGLVGGTKGLVGGLGGLVGGLPGVGIGKSRSFTPRVRTGGVGRSRSRGYRRPRVSFKRPKGPRISRARVRGFRIPGLKTGVSRRRLKVA